MTLQEMGPRPCETGSQSDFLLIVSKGVARSFMEIGPDNYVFMIIPSTADVNDNQQPVVLFLRNGNYSLSRSGVTPR